MDENKLGVGLLPDELIVEILSWLPPQFAGRCNLVCKSWRAIIKSRYFVEVHMQKQKNVVVYKDPPLQQQPFIIASSARGLLLELNSVDGSCRIRNYATAQVLQLPDFNVPRSQPHIYLGICHLPSSDEYKVSNFYWKQNRKNIGLVVFTKGTDVTWRCVEVPSLLSCYNLNDYEELYVRTLRSVIYIVKLAKVYTARSKMMAFQAQDESFVEISLPRGVEYCASPPFIPMIWDFTIAFARIVGEEVRVWVLQDYKTSKWEVRKIVFPSAVLKQHPRLLINFAPEGVYCGEVLVLDTSKFNKMNKPWRVMYNIKTHNFTGIIKRRMETINPCLVTL